MAQPRHASRSKQTSSVQIHFSDFFSVPPEVLDEYGAFNISLINDLPLFVDPFLLFNSNKEEYQQLHAEIIRYLAFLRDKSAEKGIEKGLLRAWFTFREVRQNWFGYSLVGNYGSGLGMDFAHSLNQNLNTVFSTFGDEQVTKGSHLEKLCLIEGGVGRDNISDFTTNLIKDFLLKYTERFAGEHLSDDQKRTLIVEKVRFNYRTETWGPGSFTLPYYNGDYVLLTPRDILTKDDVWISRPDLFKDFEKVARSIPNDQLRAQINNYFLSNLPRRQYTKRGRSKSPTKKEQDQAKAKAIRAFPEFIEHYIRYKEEHGDEAVRVSNLLVTATEDLFISQVRKLAEAIESQTAFYSISGNTYQEAVERVKYLKDVVENKGGHRVFFKDGFPIRKESDLHIMYRLVWFGTPSDVSREVNDGRGPADFKISRGAHDKTVVEFKLASNSHLKNNLQKQAEIYQKASDAERAVKVIVCFSLAEQKKVLNVLNELNLAGKPNIILIDARADNKPSASKA